jgi:seryl-tRNA synthetase
MNTKIKELKKKIQEQGEENVRLFKIFEYKMHKEEVQPLIQEWREGSNKIKAMIKELQILESKDIKKENKDTCKVFVNGYGEATNREITSSSYQSNQKRLAKDMLNYIR